MPIRTARPRARHPRGRRTAPAAGSLRRALPAAVLLALAPGTALAATEDPTAPAAPDDSLEQTLSPEEESVGGQAVLSTGHVDIGPRFTDGTWRIEAHDDSRTPPVWRPVADTVTQVADAAVQQAPDDPAFGFLDAEPGSDVYVIPQTQDPDVVWLGWNTQDPEVMERVDRGVTLTMHGAEGPGHVSVFLQNGDLGAPDVLWDGDEDGAQDLWVDVNTHTHANWVFTEPGVYTIDFEMSADLVGGEHVSDRTLMRFAVGDGTAVEDAFAAGTEPDTTTDEESPAAGPAGDRDATTAQDDGPSMRTTLLLVGAAMVMLLLLVLLAVLRSRRARRLAERETAPDAERAP
ncbi:choice-of-anchor M domain-containing protein [Streptomyces sp. RFCAC02]|uniref:choice-of-anchor M domain-containing protein n=1 Tax=Streptomyces sp. RFCAC02 TaxID=2499143 RepID=UPI0010214F1F|nr:choice-of-anchor M domain-containing protein [Streptomyces sp. RFCAC02]